MSWAFCFYRSLFVVDNTVGDKGNFFIYQVF
jgi:hypothetical protein